MEYFLFMRFLNALKFLLTQGEDLFEVHFDTEKYSP